VKNISPVGVMIVTLSALVGIAMWVVGYIGLPNIETHRNLKENPPIASSVPQNSTGTGTTTGSSTGTGTAAVPAFYSLDAAPNTLDLNIDAATTKDNSGMNFEGYSNGDLKITVPKGWKVNVTFGSKDQMMPHSIGFTTWDSKQATGSFVQAFPGSIGPKFTQGIMSTDPSLKFSFTANKAGQYAFVCGVPGHAAGGMWNEFDVSATAKSPTVTAGGQTVTVTK
jgi:sulfocyanin